MDLGKFLNENLESQQQVDEGIKEIAAGLSEKIKKIYNAAKSSVVNIGGKVFGLFKKGKGEMGVTDAAGVERIHISEQFKGGLRFYGIGLTNGTKIGATNESIFDELKTKLFEADTMNIAPTSSDTGADAEQKADKTGAMRHMFGLGGQLKGTKIDQTYKQSYDGKPEGTITVEQMKQLFGRLAFQVKFRTRHTQYIPSILVFGSPGEAKTAIGTQVAKAIGARYKSIEVASIYTEIFGGMPISQDVYDSETGRSKTTKEGKQIRKIGNLLFEGKKGDLDKSNKKYGLVQHVLTGNNDAIDDIEKSPEQAALLTLQAVYLKRALTGKWDDVYKPTKKALQTMGYEFQGEESAKNENKEYSGVQNVRYITEADGQKVSQRKKKIVELVPVKGVLPDPGNKDPWLLALDEFSRTDKKMSAVMNLLLTGAIGTIYFLPLKTIVAATSNLGGKGGSDDSDGEQVSKITGAMLTRFNYVVKVQGKINDAVSFIMGGMNKMTSNQEEPDFDPTADSEEWEIKHKNFELDPALAEKWDKMIPPSLWLNYIIRNGLEQGQYHRQDLESFQAGTPVKLNPRLVDRVSKNVSMAALQDWESGDLVKPVGKSKAASKEWYEKNYDKEEVPVYDPKEDKWTKKKLPSPQAFYLMMNQGHKRYLEILKASLMKGGQEVLADIEAAHEKTQKEMILGDTEQVLIKHVETALKYNDDENKLAELETVARSAKDIILDEIPRRLVKIGSIENYKKMIKGIDWKKMGFTNEYWYLATNIWRFTDDAMCSGDEIAGLAISIGQTLSEVEDEKTAEFLGTLASVLADDDQYKAALGKLDDIDLQDFNFDAGGEDDIDDLFGESLNEAKTRNTANNFKDGIKKFMNMQLRQIKKAGHYDEFNELANKQKGTKIESYFKALWLAIQKEWFIPVEVSEPRGDDMKKESIVIEKGLKNLFENLRG